MDESSPVPVERRQPAGSLVPLVIGFGDPLHILEVSAGEGTGARGSFLAGLMPGHTATSFVGRISCMQIYLTPLAVGRLLGHPGSELAGHVIDPAALVPEFAGSFADRLGSCGTWGERFQLVEARLLGLLARGGDADPLADWLWTRLRATGGRASIARLVDEAGWSHRHVSATFRRHAGVSPKAFAGIVRFEHAVADLGRHTPAAVADRHGYADQSHLTREAVRLAGATPAAFARRPPPTAHTALGTRPG